MLAYCNTKKRKAVQAYLSIQLGGVKGICMVAFLLLMALLWPLAQKAHEVK